MKIRKLLASATTALLIGLGLSLVATSSASAHTGGVTGVAECQPDGTVTITWTYTATNVPDGVEAETKAMNTSQGTLAPIDGVDKGGQIFLSVWTDHQINVPGAPVKTGNWSAKYKTVGIPGTFVGKVTSMVQTDWKNGPSEDPVGEVEVPGDCKPPVVVPEKPADLTGVETRTLEPVCVVPANGTATVVTEERTWTQSHVLIDNKWVLGEKTFGDWVVKSTATVELEKCEPPVTPPTEEPPAEEPPAEEPPAEEEPPATTPSPSPTPIVVAEEPEAPVTALAATGVGEEATAKVWGLTWAAVALAVFGAIGVVIARVRQLRKQ